MSYSAAEARREMLEVIASAIDDIAIALAAIGGAYELLDETTGDALEQRLFRPAQLALGRAQRTYNGFAERSGVPARSFAQPSSGLPSQGVTGFLEAAGNAAEEADETLSSLQDSLRPVEVGDAELRAGLSEVRTLLARLPGETRTLLRTLGR